VVPRAVLDGLTSTVFLACVIMIRIGETWHEVTGVLCVVTPCVLVSGYQHFEGNISMHICGFAPKVGASCFSICNHYLTTGCHEPESSILQSMPRLMSYSIK
jgi:hypothetical protein